MYRWAADECARQNAAATFVCALFWSTIVVIFCAVLGVGAARQVNSAGWPKVTGTVTASEITGRKRNFWKLEYTYSVNGRPITGDRFAYDPMPIQGEIEVQRHISAYPVGAAVDVSYDPQNPEAAVLRPGLRGCSLWVALFLAPFVLVGVGMWSGVVRRCWSRPVFNPTDSRQIGVTETGAIAIRPELRTWFATFLTLLGIATFATAWAIFFLGFALGLAYHLFDGFLFDPPLGAPASLWAAVIAGCALATWRSVRRPPALIVDGIGRLLKLGGFGSAVEVPFAAIERVTVTEQVHQRKGGNFLRYRVEVERNDGGAAFHVAEYDQRRDSEAFAEWLRNSTL
jgi:hypothetical protein